MNKFLIQLSLRDHQLHNYVNALKYINADYSFFSIYAEHDLLDNLPENLINGGYVSFAGIKALKLSRNLNPKNFENINFYNAYKVPFSKSFFYNEDNFDQKNNEKLTIPMLNKNCELVKLPDSLNRTFNVDKFIKPTSDLKGFIGGILKSGQTIGDFLENTSKMTNWIDEITLISDVKEIHSEYRFFVVNSEVITGSRYMLNNSVSTSAEIPEAIIKKAIQFAKAYNPERVFTMDLCLLNSGDIEIVEYNCFNGSGTYDAPLNDLVKVLSEIDMY